MRLQAQKVYVQDRLRESGKLVWQLLQEGAHFYVCGDAAHMAGSVEQALLHIIQHHQVWPAASPCSVFCSSEEDIKAMMIRTCSATSFLLGACGVHCYQSPISYTVCTECIILLKLCMDRM